MFKIRLSIDYLKMFQNIHQTFDSVRLCSYGRWPEPEVKGMDRRGGDCGEKEEGKGQEFKRGHGEWASDWVLFPDLMSIHFKTSFPVQMCTITHLKFTFQ